MAKFKGTIYLTAKLFTEKRYGDAAVDRVLRALAPSERQILAEVTPVGWYPVEPILGYHRKLDEIYGTGDSKVCVELGKFSAQWALNTVLKLFLRFKSPAWIMDRSSSLWSRYHDSGRWEVLESADVQLLARLHAFEVKDEAFCARFKGWLLGAIELTGGKGPEVLETNCACRGDAHCEFQAKWQ